METIVALSTPPGTSGLAVIRLSGPACLSVARVHLGRGEPVPRHVYYGAFRGRAPGAPASGMPSAHSAGEILDRLNFVHFPAPASSTGEDVLELYPHGNMLLVDRILKALLDHPGVRLAGPGEFTRRSFESGKVDLLQAEAVGQLIHAQTVSALRNAQRIADGDLSAPLKGLRDSLVDLSVRLELDVDFSEEEADPDYASWMPRLEAVRAALDGLAAGFDKGRNLARPPRVVILGAPNAGKSSLINALVEEDRLLVSDIPGTTRDYVEVTLRLPSGLVHLVDTAGLGRPVDGLDGLAMERTRRQSEQADLRIWVQDGTSRSKTGQTGTTPEAFAESADPEVTVGDFSLRIRTKSDLPGFVSGEGSLSVSSRTRSGLDAFRSSLDALVFRDRGAGEDIMLTTERQFRAVEAARDRVDAALQGMRGRPAIEILAFEVREAAGHLRELLGEISTDEVLGKIFSGFCIGK
ncbi:MAG: tRNA modification GTPase MnmE [Fibrobacteres bacterium]|nr:tRNA modification GTPase MnmE [Fibrobacterota bacterium]